MDTAFAIKKSTFACEATSAPTVLLLTTVRMISVTLVPIELLLSPTQLALIVSVLADATRTRFLAAGNPPFKSLKLTVE